MDFDNLTDKDIEDMSPEERKKFVGELMYDKHELDQTICYLEDRMEKLAERLRAVADNYSWIKSDDPAWTGYPTSEELLVPSKASKEAKKTQGKIRRRLRKFGAD